MLPMKKNIIKIANKGLDIIKSIPLKIIKKLIGK